MLSSSHFFVQVLWAFFKYWFRLCMLQVKMRRLTYSSAHATIFLTDDPNVCCNSRARTKKYKKKQYFSTVHISLTILQMFLCSWTLCEVCADIASSSIFPTDPRLLKTNCIWCANYRNTQENLHNSCYDSKRVFSNIVFRLCTFHVHEKSRVQHVGLPKAKHISLFLLMLVA